MYSMDSVGVTVSKISLIQAYMIIMLSVGLLNHVIIIPLLLSASGRDAWLVVLVVLVFSPLWVVFLNYIIKNMNGKHFKDWLHQHFGLFISLLITGIYSVLIWLIAFISLKDTVTWAIASYLPQTPLVVLTGLTLIACFFAAYQGLPTIAMVSGILLPFVIILGDLVMTANFQFKDYSLLFPLLENGLASVWKGIPYISGGLLELSLLILFQHNLKKKPGFKGLMLVCILLAGLTFGPLTGSIAIFGADEAANQRYPAYEQWRMVRLGEYVEHVDFFSIYQWLSGMFIRISLSIYLIGELWKPYNKWLIMLCSTVLMFGAVFAPISDMVFQQLLSRYYFPSFCFFTATVMSIFVIKILISKRHARSNSQ
ncbi:endospore germination permease [Brevibacillus panacihumi]|uniref:endospore germination permease n=1 Tax=Brevibacillus panacihumi TaxID=497735 RepID=UPI003D01EC95